MLRTLITDEFGLSYPILSAGMARVSQAALTAAVSMAGGLGCLGGISFMPDNLRAEIRSIRARTDRPFAVDLVVPEDMLASKQSDIWSPVLEETRKLSAAQRDKMYKGIEPLLTPNAVLGQIEVVLEEKPPILALTFNVPKYIVDAAHARGMKVLALCGTVRRAREAEAAGVDYVVAQGAEGGGHTGYIGTLGLIPAVVDAVKIPVIAAGGITDGRGLAAALCLGAEAVWCGTRFIASDEAYGHAQYKKRILASQASDTRLTKSYTGKNLRTLRNEWTERWDEGTHEVKPFPAQYAIAAERTETGYQDGEIKEGMMPAGQGVGLVHKIMPAAEILREMADEAERILSGAGRGSLL